MNHTQLDYLFRRGVSCKIVEIRKIDRPRLPTQCLIFMAPFGLIACVIDWRTFSELEDNRFTAGEKVRVYATLKGREYQTRVELNFKGENIQKIALQHAHILPQDPETYIHDQSSNEKLVVMEDLIAPLDDKELCPICSVPLSSAVSSVEEISN